MSKGEGLLNEFGADAMNWGWTQDQGTGRSVDISEAHYKRSRAELLDHIQNLEAALAMIHFKQGE